MSLKGIRLASLKDKLYGLESIEKEVTKEEEKEVKKSKQLKGRRSKKINNK